MRKSRKAGNEKTRDRAFYWVGIYLRLSVVDERKEKNHSLETQEKVIRKFIERIPDLVIKKVYRDENVSGTHFNRPAFLQMMEDMEKGDINCVCVKDLSRLGRNYIETGKLLEKVFPSLGVRFLSVNDGYDSLRQTEKNQDLEIAIKNLMHELYAKDISKKVRSQYERKKMRGEFCGPFAPYGYQKEGQKLIVNQETFGVVTKIFAMAAEGENNGEIARYLNEQGILSPTGYRVKKGEIHSDRLLPCKNWYASSVGRILQNPVYGEKLLPVYRKADSIGNEREKEN